MSLNTQESERADLVFMYNSLETGSIIHDIPSVKVVRTVSEFEYVLMKEIPKE